MLQHVFCLLATIGMVAPGTNDTTRSDTSETITPAQRELADVVLRGMKDSRDRLASGVFRVRGRKVEERGESQPRIDAPVEYYCAFDYLKGLLRFDSSTPQVTDATRARLLEKDSEGEKLTKEEIALLIKPSDGGELAVYHFKCKFIRTPEHIVQWTMWNPRQLIRSRSEQKPSSPLTQFDIRCLGLIALGDVSIGITFSELWNLVSSQELIDVAEEENGLFRLVWKFGQQGYAKRTAWFDKNAGYSPVRMELRGGELSSAAVAVSEVTWTKVSEVWVPQTILMKTFKPFRDELSCSVEWVSVNESVDDKNFTPQGLGLQGRVEILSNELGSMVSLGHLEEQGEIRYRKNGSATARPSNYRRLIIAGASVFVVAVLLSVLFLRRRTRT